MKEIAELIRRKQVEKADAPMPRGQRNSKQIAQSIRRKTVLDDHDFLAGDVSDYESDQYIDPTGLEDDSTRVEGTGDARKKMLLKAMAKSRNK